MALDRVLELDIIGIHLIVYFRRAGPLSASNFAPEFQVISRSRPIQSLSSNNANDSILVVVLPLCREGTVCGLCGLRN